MVVDFDNKLRKYADLIVQVGLNLQPGQRLLISDARNGGVALDAAPLVRQIVAAAYRQGARLVDVLWNDDEVQLARFRHAPRDSFSEFGQWFVTTTLESVERGDAMLTVVARDPGLLSNEDPDAVLEAQRVFLKSYQPVMSYVMRNAINWCVVTASAPAWAATVMSDAPATEQSDRLWDAIFQACRVDQTDPVAAWRQHVQNLRARADYLNARQYSALHFRGPGTDLTVGLPAGHLWGGAQMPSEKGINFTANIPTEEVFTLPHLARTHGTVRSTRPLSYAGTIIDDFSVTFEQGQVVSFSAGKGEAALRGLLEADEGARRLGEVALVPHSSPISQSNIMFFNTLFDENASSHIALGRAYRFTMMGGEDMSAEEFTAAGGNDSLVHVDFMIGSGDIDVDGVDVTGQAEPVMRRGEWAFAV